ncbi:MAG: tetratricopeptide repeat protein [Saprospiraceae bacterium]|nr:tetratricopeptide repeat protein [Saprospiraceae bacterium]
MKNLLFAALFVSCSTIPQAQVPSLQEGIKQLQNENYAAALTTFNAIAKSDSKNGTIYYYIGEVSYVTDVPAEAEKAYKKGLTINPQCAECKVGLGKLMLDQGKAMEAEEFFQSASKLDKKNPEIFAVIGDAYLNNKKPNGSKAIEYLSLARDMNPGVAKYWAHLGDAYELTGNHGEAMTGYETAIKKDPTISTAYISMARIWTKAKQDSLAIPLLEKAIELSPDDAQPYKYLIELYIKNGKYNKVTPLLDKYVSLSGDDVDAKVRLVKFLTFQAKDYDRAILEGEKLLQTNPEQYTLHRWLAWAYGEKGDYQHSYDHSEMLFQDLGKKEDRAAFPSDYDYYAKAALKLGKIDDAAHIYRKYLELDPSRSQEINGMLAKGYYDIKNYDQAEAYYLRKGVEKPLNAVDNYYLGLSYYLSDQDLEADSIFAKILEVTPEHATSWLMRARIATRLDTTEVKLGLAKEPYENYIKYTYIPDDKEKNVKNMKNLKEAYDYLGRYWIQQEEKDNVKAKGYFEKILELDPTDPEVLEILRILNSQNGNK